MPPPIASTSPIRTLRRGEGVPAILGNAREDAKLVVAERLDRRADRACLGASGVGQVALLRAVLVAGHLIVVLAEIGRRMAEVEDKPASLQRGKQRLAGERLGRGDGRRGSENKRAEREN